MDSVVNPALYMRGSPSRWCIPWTTTSASPPLAWLADWPAFETFLSNHLWTGPCHGESRGEAYKPVEDGGGMFTWSSRVRPLFHTENKWISGTVGLKFNQAFNAGQRSGQTSSCSSLLSRGVSSCACLCPEAPWNFSPCSGHCSLSWLGGPPSGAPSEQY